MPQSSVRLFLFVLIVLVAQFADPAPSRAAATPAYAAALQPLLVAQMRELHVPGAIVYVDAPAKGGAWTATLGTSDLKTRAPMRRDFHTRIGSITKTLTGTIVLQLVDRKQLRLEDPVSKYAPQVPNGSHIRIEQLLNMTSGLYNYSEDPGLNRALDVRPQTLWPPDELLAIAFRHAPYFPPGGGYHYSNTNTVLLGTIAEKLTGKSLSYLFATRIFGPLHMTQSSLPDSGALPAPHPRGYMYGTNVSTLTEPAVPAGTPIHDVTGASPSWGWAAGAAVSTLHDVTIWAKALATGTLLTPATQRRRLTWVSPGKNTPVKYGLAIFNIAGFLGHNGELPGFQSFMGYRPADGATIIVFTNLSLSPSGKGTADELTQTIVKQLFAR